MLVAIHTITKARPISVLNQLRKTKMDTGLNLLEEDPTLMSAVKKYSLGFKTKTAQITAELNVKRNRLNWTNKR